MRQKSYNSEDDESDTDDLALLSMDYLQYFDDTNEVKKQWSDVFGQGMCSLCRMNIGVLNKAA